MKINVLLLILFFNSGSTFAQHFYPVYNEAEVLEYKLPKILLSDKGEKIASVEDWEGIRRNEIFYAFENLVYGAMPEPIKYVSATVIAEDKNALNGAATMKEIRILFDKSKQVYIDLLCFVPNKAEKPVPAFLLMNFDGNQSVHPNKHIQISESWMPDDSVNGYFNNRATEASRGYKYWRFPVERIIDRGYALFTFYYGDIDPDFHDGFKNGAHQLFESQYKDTVVGNNCGSLGAWAWGLSRAMDYIETLDEINPNQVAVSGHSRLGKAALWAGAADERFAMVISNNSGCGGAALSKRAFGETVEIINSYFPHWFCQNFKQFNANENEMPVDQHMLLSLIAPRPLYVASAEDDLWADPRGEFLSLKHASVVYQLYGVDVQYIQTMPRVNFPVYQRVGYHIRSGKHDLTNYDWEIYLDFADQYFKE